MLKPPAAAIALDRLVRRAGPGKLFWTIVVVDALVLALIFATVLWPTSARLTLQAQTEVLSVDLPDGSQGFPWGDLPVDRLNSTNPPLGCTSPTMDLNDPLEGPLTMRAVMGSAGALLVTLSRPGGSVGPLHCADGSVVASGPAVRFRWQQESAKRATLSFIGHLTVGDTLVEGLPEVRLLRGGTLTVTADGGPFGAGAGSETKLSLGDRVQFLKSDDEREPAIAHGILRAGADGALDVTAHANGREARVIHIGSEEGARTSVAPSFWAKLQAQPVWAAALSACALLLNILAAARSYREEQALLDLGQQEPHA